MKIILSETAVRSFADQQSVQGQDESVTDQEVIAEVLREFYNMSQGMVGEAISVSELNAFVKGKHRSFSCQSH